AAAIVGVRAPELSLLVRERGSLGHDANGNLAVRNAGKNLNGADNRLSSFADKLQVQLSIGTWVDIPEHALVGNIRSARLREDIGIVHEYAPVQLDQEGAAVFPAACTHSRSVNSFHEEQMKLIRAWFQGNVVGKLACADVLEEHRIVRAPDKLVRAVSRPASREISITLPNISHGVGVASRGASRQKAQRAAGNVRRGCNRQQHLAIEWRRGCPLG